MVRAALAVALLLAPEWQVEKGKRFDIFARRKATAARFAPEAEDAAQRFEELLGSFPGERAAIVVRRPDDPKDAGDPAWPEFGAKWVFLCSEGVSLHLSGLPAGEPDLMKAARFSGFRRGLALEMLVRWSDLDVKEPPRGDGSGTRLPDWWEDAVAGWCEAETIRESLRTKFQAIRSLRKTVPLDEMLLLVRAADPGYADLPALPFDPKDLPDDLGPVLAEALKKARRLPVLPAQSFSFLEYLVEDEGIPFVRHLARVLAEGHGMKNALPWLEKNRKERRHPKAVVPKTIRELELAWTAWLDARGR